MISTLVYILVVAVVIGLIIWIVQQLPVPEPWGNIIRVCVIVIGALIIILALLGLIGVGPGLPALR